MSEEAADLARELKAQDRERLRAREEECLQEAIAADSTCWGDRDESIKAADKVIRRVQEARTADALDQAVEDAKARQPVWVGSMPEPPATDRDRALPQEVAEVRQELETLRRRVDKIEGADSAN